MSLLLSGIVVWLLGLCIGSFLNVVIYRIPLGLSVNKPTRSFCPGCNTTLAWFDNLPVLSWLLLRGRCRSCGVAISAQYPLVEALTGLLFVMAFYLLVVQNALGLDPAGELPLDAGLLAAWLVLFAALVVLSVMDLVSYYIDPVVTNVAILGGIVGLAAWPRPDQVLPIADSSYGAGGVAMFIASAAWLWWSERRIAQQLAAEPIPEQVETEPAADPAAPGGQPPPSAIGFSAGAAAAAILLALSIGFLATIGSPGLTELAPYLLGAAFLITFFAMVRTAAMPRSADEQIHGEIEEEAPEARRQSLRELFWLLGPIVAGVAAWWAVAYVPAAGEFWSVAMRWSPGGAFVPLAGVTFAMHGAMVGAAAGWAVRIVFTLLFGREAFGLGDVFILAAAGACGGWAIALLGFLISVGVALIAWTLSLLSKRSVMIAFGPPLALGFVLALWWYLPAVELIERIKSHYGPAIQEQPGLFAGFFLASGVIAVVVSRMLRRAIEPGSAGDAAPTDEPPGSGLPGSSSSS